jgi:hypothetical protein
MLTKEKYIAKYGEDAWEKEAVKRSERAKNYYNSHKEKYRENEKRWRENNRDKRHEIDRRYHKKHREELLEKAIQYRINNHEKIIDREKRFKEEHRVEILERNREYDKQRRDTPKYRAKNLLHAYRQIDCIDNRGKCTLTQQWIIDNIFNSSCIFCGDSDWTHLGADRIDNSKPHTPDNCVCACGICNIERSDRYSVEEFKKYRALHPRACDIPKGPVIELSETGALKKRAID